MKQPNLISGLRTVLMDRHGERLLMCVDQCTCQANTLDISYLFSKCHLQSLQTIISTYLILVILRLQFAVALYLIS